jgi:urease gamma subunit
VEEVVQVVDDDNDDVLVLVQVQEVLEVLAEAQEVQEVLAEAQEVLEVLAEAQEVLEEVLEVVLDVHVEALNATPPSPPSL